MSATADEDDAVLPERIRILLQKARITSAETVFTTAALTYRRLGLSAAEVDRIRCHYSPKSLRGFVTATASLTANAAQWRRITFGCAALDRLTRNGLPVRGLTELSGCAGAGKSQLCMQLALMVQLPVDLGGLGGAAVYICTEGAFASGRLFELIESVRSQFGSRMYDHPFASGVLLDHLSDATALRRCVRTDLPRLMCNRNDVRLVVIDSMAGVFRTETDDIRQRAHHMREVAAGLLDLSERYGCAVVCVNQVTSVMNDDRPFGAERLVPCLGLAWANLVTTRLQLHRSRDCMDGTNSTVKRSMEVVFSPELAPGRANFAVTGAGVCDVLSPSNG